MGRVGPQRQKKNIYIIVLPVLFLITYDGICMIASIISSSVAVRLYLVIQ